MPERDILSVEGHPSDGKLTTVGVLLTPRPDGLRDFDTTVLLVRGDVGFDDDQLALLRKHWPDEQP
jgi:hypothetical protein